MAIKDALGNDLKVGDLVAIQLARPLVFGEVVEATEGGLLTGPNQMQPGRVVVVTRHVIDVDSRAMCEALLALRNDHDSTFVKPRPLIN